MALAAAAQAALPVLLPSLLLHGRRPACCLLLLHRLLRLPVSLAVHSLADGCVQPAVARKGKVIGLADSLRAGVLLVLNAPFSGR